MPTEHIVSRPSVIDGTAIISVFPDLHSVHTVGHSWRSPDQLNELIIPTLGQIFAEDFLLDYQPDKDSTDKRYRVGTHICMQHGFDLDDILLLSRVYTRLPILIKTWMEGKVLCAPLSLSRNEAGKLVLVCFDCTKRVKECCTLIEYRLDARCCPRWYFLIKPAVAV